MDISCYFGDKLHLAEKLAGAINLAVENGADVINNSWNYAFGYTNAHIPLLEDAIDCAIDSLCTIIFAAGNTEENNFNPENNVSYPANYRPEIIVVGAIRNSDNYLEVADFSCYGQETDISAPGVNIFSAHNNNTYKEDKGTSQAAVHVSGVAALMKSINPNLYYTEISDYLKQTAQKIASPDYYYDSLHNCLWDMRLGYGVVDAHCAVMKAAFNKVYGDTTMSLCATKSYTISAPHNVNIDSISFFWTASDNLKILGNISSDTVQIQATGVGLGKLTCNIIHDGDTVSSSIDIQIETNLTSYENISLSGNISYPDYLIISGILNIDSLNTVSWVGNTVFATSTARLIVRPGGKLVVDGGTLTSACAGEMWQGIEIVGNPNKRQLAQYQGFVELKNGATIENAKCAVLTGLRNSAGEIDATTLQTAGGILKANNTTFRNNARAVEILPYADVLANGSIRRNACGFGHCTFVNDNNNLFAQNNCPFTEFLRFNDVNGIELYSCSFTNAIPLTRFTSYRAIYTEDAGFYLTKTCPSGYIWEDCVCDESFSTYNTFSGFNTAIEANTTGSQYAIQIDQSKFNNVATAIRINGNNFTTITRDSIDITQSAGNNPFRTGIYLNNCTGYLVEQNHIKGVKQQMTGSTVGIIVNNSGNANNKLYRNAFNTLNFGITVRGNNGDSLQGLIVACADFTNVNNNIFLANNATMKSTANETINNCVSTLCGINPFNPGILQSNGGTTNNVFANNDSQMQTDQYFRRYATQCQIQP